MRRMVLRGRRGLGCKAMSGGERTRAACLASAMAELPRLAMPDDMTDAERFPEITKARAPLLAWRGRIELPACCRISRHGSHPLH